MRDIDQYEKDYLDNPFEGEMVSYRHKKTLESIHRYKPLNILEVGCGLVPLYRYHRDFESLTIFEPSGSFADNAKRDAPDNVVVINDYLGESYATAFDFIVISSLLHELEDPLELLRMATAFAGRDTIVHINVPNVRSMHRLLALRMGLIESLVEKSARQVRFQQHHNFDMDSLEALVVTAGLQVISCESFFVKPFTHEQMQTLIDNGILTEQMLDGLYGLSEDLPGLGAEIAMDARLSQT